MNEPVAKLQLWYVNERRRQNPGETELLEWARVHAAKQMMEWREKPSSPQMDAALTTALMRR